IANTLKLKSGTAFPVGPSTAYNAALGKTLGTLGTKVKAGQSALKGAGNPKAQAAAAGKLSSAYSAAAKSLGGLKLSPADQSANAQLTKALNGVAKAYAALAAAA